MKTAIVGLIPNTRFAAFIGQFLLAGACFLSTSAHAAVDDWPATSYYSPYDPLSDFIVGQETQMFTSLACLPSVNVSLDQNGQALITPAMLVPDPDFPIGLYSVNIMGPLQNVVTCDEIGVPLMAVVTELPTGNTCMSELHVEDKLKPVLVCEDDTIPCNTNLLALDYLEFLELVDDNCDDDPTVYFEYTVTELNCDPGGIAGYVDITYHATDDYGNQSSCHQFIYLEKFDLIDVVFPADTSINCDGANTDPEVIGGPTIGGLPIHHFCELLAWKTDNIVPMCSGQYKVNRLWRVMDWCTGQQITDPQVILVIDTVPPEIVCPVDVTLGTSLFQCSANYTFPSVSVTDICSDPAFIDVWFTNSEVPGIFYTGGGVVFDTGVHTVTVHARDDCNNTSTCEYTVTVVDDDNPVIVCNNLNITLDQNGMAFLNASSSAFYATDNCGVASRAIRRMDDNCNTPANLIFGPQVKFCCEDVGEIVMVIFQAIDFAGNVSTCMIQVNVHDKTPPVALCKSACIFLDEDGEAILDVDSIDNGSHDNCEIIDRVLSKTDYDCSDIGFNVVILTVSDVGGNTASCSAIVQVKDTLPPEAECTDITVELNDMGMIVITVDTIDVGSSDNCGIDTIFLSEDTFDCSDIGENEVDLIVIDEEGLSDTCTAIVTIEEMPPMVICMDVTVYLDENGEVVITPDDVDAVSDDCSMPTREVNPDSLYCSDVGDNVVILTATDDSGNTATCSAIVTVLDTLVPLCDAMDLTVQLDADGSVTLAGDALDDGSTDNCEIETITINPNTFTCENTDAPVLVVQTVTDVNGNSSTCTALVTVQDNIDPICLTMNIVVQLNAAGTATISDNAVNNGSSDNCGIQSILLNDTQFTCVDVGMVVVTQTVTDVNGNTSTCTAIVTVQDNIDPTCLTQDITVQLDADGDFTISNMAVNNGSSDACGILSITVTPSAFDCDDIGVIIVTQTVTDVNGNSSTCTADVTVEDNIDPICLTQDITVQLGSDGTVTIPGDAVDDGSSDNCDDITITVNPNTFDCDSPDTVVVVQTVTDNSGNTSTCTAVVTVEDSGELNAECQNLTVSLDANGQVIILAVEVDNGSGGGCASGDLMFSLDEAVFDCSETGPNLVVLTVTDSEGNSDTCTAIITVEDDLPPVLICPSDVPLDCDDPIDIEDLSPYGTPITSDNCPPVMLNEEVEDNRDECGQGTIVRTFVATDPSGNSSQCSQTITVMDPDPFDVTDIMWPPAVVNLGQCSSTDPGPGNQPVIDSGTCTNISVDFDDVVTMMVDNNPLTPCIQITRMWTVIDSCQLDEGTGTFTFTQMIIQNDNVGPIFSPQLNDVTVDADTVTCDMFVNLVTSASDCGMATTVTNNYNDGGGNASDDFPIGTTTVIFTSTDACGNISTMDVNITVLDPDPPGIECEKIIRFLDDFEITVLAEEFINFTPGACVDFEDIQFSYSDDPLDTLRVFMCGQVGVEPVDIYSFDLDGNPIDTCRADLDLRDTLDLCGDGLTITGEIFGETRSMIGNVPVLISDPSMQIVSTGPNGRYFYIDLGAGNSYAITPFWNVNHKHGVTTLDLVSLQKHLLGIRPLDSPYKLLAADANNSGTITVSDLIEVRRLLLNLIPEFTNNTSWRFIDAHFDFPDPQNPWILSFPESMNFAPLTHHETQMDFVGVKIGDVNNTVFNIQPEDVDVRSANAMILAIEDRPLKAGEAIKLPIVVNDYHQLIGYQFAFHVDPDKAAVEGITLPDGSFLSTEWFGLNQLSEGLVTTLWYEREARTIGAGEVLFNISLQAKQNILLSELLTLDKDYLNAEAYGKEEQVIPVRLSIDGKGADFDFEVFQNVPNPFTEGTLIPIQIPETSVVVLEVYTYDGRLVHRQSAQVDIGYHQFEINAKDLERSGMYYYTIATERFRGTRKMILLK